MHRLPKIRQRVASHLEFAHELRVILPTRLLGLQIAFFRLHRAVHVRGAGDDRVIAGVGRRKLAGEELPGIFGVLAVQRRRLMSGLVNKEMELTLDELKRRPRAELIAGFECSGNSPARLNTEVGNARWTGTSLAALLKEAGLKSTAREVVYFGADHGTEEIAHGGAQPEKYEQNFARSFSVEDALNPDVLLVWEMNGEPLPAKNGGPVRMLVPGWYGVCNAKWLNHIQLQDRRFMGRFMARDYVTLIQRKDGDQTIWEETSVSRIQLKSMVARLERDGGSVMATGFVLNDGTPLRSVELRVDNGPCVLMRILMVTVRIAMFSSSLGLNTEKEGKSAVTLLESVTRSLIWRFYWAF